MARRIVVVGFEGITALDLVGPMDVFDTAGRVATNSASRNDAYELIVAAPKKTPFRTTSGLRIQPDRALERLRGPIDTLLIAGGFGSRQAAQNTTLVRSVRRLAKQARRVGSVCTGAFVLAAAGLLNGRRAATHWMACDELAQRFPNVQVDPDPIFVRAGKYWTSAGVTAGMDLSLAMVEDDLGRDVALRAARYLVLFIRRGGGQHQFSELLQHQLADREPLRDLQAWILEHADQDLSVPTLARRVAMSPRHFARVFRQEVGETPAAYVERARIEIARRLLETTRLPVDRVAEASGFGSTPTFRRVFRRRIGVPPRTYRTRFAAS